MKGLRSAYLGIARRPEHHNNDKNDYQAKQRYHRYHG
jgi:hypothetical protein